MNRYLVLLRGINVGGKNKVPMASLREVLGELGYADVEFYIWAGLFGPKGMPEPVVTRLREAMKQAMNDPEVRKVYENAGSPPAYQDAPEFAGFVEADSRRVNLVRLRPLLRDDTGSAHQSHHPCTCHPAASRKRSTSTPSAVRAWKYSRA